MVAAVASWLDVRARGGEWLIRMDDLDPPREVPGAAEGILRTLGRFGLESDRAVVYQSTRSEAYAAALEQLLAEGEAFGCNCTRSQLSGDAVYPGTCRELALGANARAVRFRVGSGELAWEDRFAGECRFELATEVGDFVLRRADGLWAYHLAVVVDDAEAGVTDVVRGADLLDSTARHQALQMRLGVQVPRYGHLPVVVNGLGQKLSKQTQAPAVDDRPPVDVLTEAFAHLRFPLIPSDSPMRMLEAAIPHWRKLYLSHP